MLRNFGHLMNQYSAAYYGYLWASTAVTTPIPNPPRTLLGCGVALTPRESVGESEASCIYHVC